MSVITFSHSKPIRFVSEDRGGLLQVERFGEGLATREVTDEKCPTCARCGADGCRIAGRAGQGATTSSFRCKIIPASWVLANGDYANTRYSKLNQINATNVKKLQVAWTFSTGVLRGHEGGPLVIGDVMYVHTPFPNTVYALDLNNDGKIIWKYEPRQDPNVIPIMCCDTVNRGVAYADGKIFLHQADTTLVALDAKTGEEVWSVMDGEAGKGQSGTDAPFVVQGQGAGRRFRRRIRRSRLGRAYNVKDGKLAWRAYSEGPDSDTLIDPDKTTSLGKPVGKDSGTATWEGDQWKIGGGTTWGWYSYDPDLNLVYYGSGNPGTWNPVQRPGDNRWSMSIFARDPDTGKAKWVYQMTPHDEWDYRRRQRDDPGRCRSTARPQAAGPFRSQRLRLHAGPRQGELLVAEKYDPAVNWATHVDMQTGRPEVVKQYSTDQQGEDVNTQGVCPAALGSKDQQPAAYSPQSLFYVPTNHVCMDYEPTRIAYVAGRSMSAPRCTCILRRAATIWATSSPGTPRRARSCGLCPSRSRCGAVRSRRPETWCSTVLWTAI